MKRQPFPPEPHCLSPQQPVRTRCSARAPEMGWGLSPGWRVHAGLLSTGPEPGPSKAASLLGRGAPQRTALRSLPALWLPSTPASPPPPARSEDFQHPTPSRLHHHPRWAPPCPLGAHPRRSQDPWRCFAPPSDTLRAHGDRRGGPPRGRGQGSIPLQHGARMATLSPPPPSPPSRGSHQTRATHCPSSPKARKGQTPSRPVSEQERQAP